MIDTKKVELHEKTILVPVVATTFDLFNLGETPEVLSLFETSKIIHVTKMLQTRLI